MSSARIFVGAFLNAGNQSYYRRVIAQVRSRFPDAVRAVKDESVHVTLAFLPYVDGVASGRLSSALERVAATSIPIAIVLEPPDILWAGRVHGSSKRGSVRAARL